MKGKLVALLSLFSFLCGCSSSPNQATLKIAASAVPQAEILRFVAPDLADLGVTLKVIEVDDYNIPNRALAEGDVDANFFQHIPFMEEQIAQFGYQIGCSAKIHLEPMGIYSKKIKDLSQLPKGATIALPNDPTNEYRALKLLESKELITLRPNLKLQATVADIISNPKQLKFREIDAAILGRSLPDVSAAAIPTNFALQAKLNPLRDALALESIDSPYANIIAIRTSETTDPRIEKLKESLLTDRVRTFILEKFQGAIIPVLKQCN